MCYWFDSNPRLRGSSIGRATSKKELLRISRTHKKPMSASAVFIAISPYSLKQAYVRAERSYYWNTMDLRTTAYVRMDVSREQILLYFLPEHKVQLLKGSKM